MKKRSFFLIFCILFCSVSAIAQNVVKGIIIDKDTDEPLIGVTIYSESEKIGAASDLDGSFVLRLKNTNQGKLKISYVGYKTLEVDVKPNLGLVKLESQVIGLKDVVVTSSMAVKRKTPVALSVVEPAVFEAKMSSQEFPEILKTTPGVYATKQGGGYGDSRINLRGFETENIAVMINGIPMNDMEWGGIYWSNFAGLSDVTRQMQVQRGLGAAKVSAPSVGGSINIVTRSTDAEKGGSIAYQLGNDGYNKVSFNVSTGLSKSGWAMSLLGSKNWGDGYVLGTDFESYTWFLNISKIINSRHTISFTGFGSSQWHNQRNRNDKMRIDEWQTVNADGREKFKFNPTYGYDENGKVFIANKNRYHKPQLSLNHLWEIDYKSSLSTALYMSLGDGGGYRFRGKNQNNLYGVSNQDGYMNNNFETYTGEVVSLRHANTLYRDYGIVQRNNRALSEMGYSASDVVSESINNHVWTGLISNYTAQFTDELEFTGGIDLRYYAGEHREKIKDLMGGAFYIDDQYRKAHKEFTGTQLEQWKNQKLRPGDDIYRNNTGYVLQTGFFTQAEYSLDDLTAFIAGSFSNHRYWKRDKYYYDNKKSDAKNFQAFTIKGGGNYNINEQHNVFVNAGFISRAPYMRSYFTRMDQNNAINADAVNEKSYSIELGYGFQSRFFSANVNLYHTKWLDKTQVRSYDDIYFLNLKGVDARHQGLEVEFRTTPIKDLEIKGMFSLGDWIWDSKATGKLYDDLGNQLGADTKPLFPNGTEGMSPEEVKQISDNNVAVTDMKNVRVGNSAQTTFSIGGNYKLFDRALTIGADYTFFGRNYADYKIDVPNIGKPDAGYVYYTPWRMPSAGVLDLHANYRFNIGGLKATLYGNVNNLLNKEYITDATDFKSRNGGGNWNDVAVFYGFGTTYTMSLKIQF